MFVVTMWEKVQIVGHADATQLNSWIIGTFDTIGQAYQERREQEKRFANRTILGDNVSQETNGEWKFSQLLVDRGRNHEYGNVYRTTWFSISSPS